jgi:hypothetical protein
LLSLYSIYKIFKLSQPNRTQDKQCKGQETPEIPLIFTKNEGNKSNDVDRYQNTKHFVRLETNYETSPTHIGSGSFRMHTISVDLNTPPPEVVDIWESHTVRVQNSYTLHADDIDIEIRGKEREGIAAIETEERIEFEKKEQI